MKRWIIICILAFTLTSTKGQEVKSTSIPSNQTSAIQNLKPYLALHNLEQDTFFIEKFERLIHKLERLKSRKKSDYAFLKAVFYKTHTSLLHEYDRLATMDQTLASGKFGCLTGTALYAILLDYFGYEYRIIELPNHVFLHLSVNDDSFVFESTLPFGGFMKTTAEMEKLLEQPWVNYRRISELSTVGDWFQDFKIVPGNYKTIDLNQLAGLQYFNEAAKFYLNKDYKTAMDLALEAYALYPSERNEKIMQLIINKILRYDLIKQELKSEYLDKYVTSVKGKKLSQTK